MALINRKRIAQAAQMACLLEVSANKPGNINRCHNFADSRFEDFLLSAIAIGPAMEQAGRASIGCTIWRAVHDTRRVVPSNTNLGMILLLSPLAKAGFQMARSRPGWSAGTMRPADLREHLAGILSGLTVEDARLAYAAFRLARPGGLGKVAQADVSEEPDITLYQAMLLAQERDSIAREYTTAFSITFEIGYPSLQEALQAGADLSAAIVQAYLAILARVPDTLIARKRGMPAAVEISGRVVEILNRGGVFTPQGQAALEELDRLLRVDDHALNPGTTADLVTAAIFLHLLLDKI